MSIKEKELLSIDNLRLGSLGNVLSLTISLHLPLNLKIITTPFLSWVCQSNSLFCLSFMSCYARESKTESSFLINCLGPSSTSHSNFYFLLLLLLLALLFSYWLQGNEMMIHKKKQSLYTDSCYSFRETFKERKHWNHHNMYVTTTGLFRETCKTWEQ